MSVRADIEDAVIAWLLAAGQAGGVPDSDYSVIVADGKGPRPAHAYIAVRVTGYDQVVGGDETYVDDSDPPVVGVRGQRTGSVSLNAYGDAAEGWLERANLMLRAPSVQALLEQAGATLRPLGPITNLSGVLDDEPEVRFHRDYAVDYERRLADDEREAAAPLELVHHEDEWQSSNPGDRTVTVDQEL